MGDVSVSQQDFQIPTQRNFFETSQGKGEQDAAGSHVKHKVSIALFPRETRIRSACNLYDFLTNKFKYPSETMLPDTSTEKIDNLETLPIELLLLKNNMDFNMIKVLK
ncbi:hypothetical protein KUTeg_018768 [Tegillarca granosa]|uniref:Uncharacterized protein n=1 Tax=Tegillarca granosa TaxID=220873 RepID=A0ABQ9EK88_TEGGR|nr:hypothetical protein KUTeg_018768 [Tegillarca granosa]